MRTPALLLLGAPAWCPREGPALALGRRRLHQLLLVLGWHGSQGCSDDDGWVTRDDLAELLWPDSRQAQARTNLRKLLLELRQTQLASIEEGAGRLRWRPGTDVDAFAQACAAGEWLQAAETGHGQPLEGLGDDGADPPLLNWLQAQRQAHQQRWRAAAAQALPLATPSQAAELAERLLQADPQDAAALAQLQGTGVRSLECQLAPVSSMVGRESELPQLLALLQRSRLVTLLGPGGVGKSRLARHAADALAPQFSHGAAVVMLDDLSTPAALPARVADSLGLVLPPHADPLLALSRLLAPRAMLLVLDGFEAVIDAAADVPRWLAAAPGLQLLVTSRERLDVDGECLLPLASLAVPAAAAEAALVMRSPAVQLFAERAVAVQPAFELSEHWPAVADICRCVGGLPLALEWAAAWMRVMPAADLAQDLARDLSVDGDAGPVAVFESSWRLLTASERRAYAALAVFRGGFTREAAREVAGVGLAQLASLVDKSMLRSQPQGRLDMHPLVHAHARSKLALHAEAAGLAACHARWYLALLQRSRPLPGAENENLLAAWHHAVQQADAQAVQAALGRILWSSVVEGWRVQAVQLLESAAVRFGASTTTGAVLRAHQAWTLLWQDDDEQAFALAQQAAAVLQAQGHGPGLAMCLRTLGHAARRACRPQQAVQHFSQALELARQHGDQHLQAALHDALAMALLQLGDFEAARLRAEQSLAMNLASADQMQHMYNRFNLAQAHLAAGRAEQALAQARQALTLGQTVAFPMFLPYLHVQLARVLLAMGRWQQAWPQVEYALARARDTGDASAMVWALDVKAQAAWQRGDAPAASSALLEALRWGLRTRNLALGPMLLPTVLTAFGSRPEARHWAQVPEARLLGVLASELLGDTVQDMTLRFG